MQAPISISGITSVSALGCSEDEVWQNYLLGKPLFEKKNIKKDNVWISQVSAKVEAELKTIRREYPAYKSLDRSVLLAILGAKKGSLSHALGHKNIGINIGSSRGATGLFEKYHAQFLKTDGVSAYSSPTTTLGNISSWVGQELRIDGPSIGHSVTCSTAMHAVLNGIAWLQSDMADAFIVGGSEAALTPFTIAQMKALKLYSKLESQFACESMNLVKRKNSMVLGEAAAIAILEKEISKNTQAIITGYGYGTEVLVHGSSISESADCFQKSMKMAMKKAQLKTVDAIVLHAPGTVKGDMAEAKAIETVFDNSAPLLTSNKWLIGHTFGASGMVSIEMAVLMLKHNHFIENPFFENKIKPIRELRNIMVNAVGFGGNAVSIIVSKP